MGSCCGLSNEKPKQPLPTTIKNEQPVPVIKKNVNVETQTSFEASMVRMNCTTFRSIKPVQDEVKTIEKESIIPQAQQMLSSIVVKLQYQPLKRRNTMKTTGFQSTQNDVELRQRKFSQKDEFQQQQKSQQEQKTPLSLMIQKKKKEKNEKIPAPRSTPKPQKKGKQPTNKVTQSFCSIEPIIYQNSYKQLPNQQRIQNIPENQTNPQKQSDLSLILKQNKELKRQNTMKHDNQNQQQQNKNKNKQIFSNSYYSQKPINGSILDALANRL